MRGVLASWPPGATTDLKQIEDKRLHSDRLSFMAYLRAGFHEADKDGNGKLTRSEFLQWATAGYWGSFCVDNRLPLSMMPTYCRH